MLQSKLLRDRGILVLSPQGPIEKAEVKRFEYAEKEQALAWLATER